MDKKERERKLMGIRLQLEKSTPSLQIIKLEINEKDLVSLDIFDWGELETVVDINELTIKETIMTVQTLVIDSKICVQELVLRVIYKVLRFWLIEK